MKDLAHSRVELVVGNGAPEGGLAVHYRFGLDRLGLVVAAAAVVAAGLRRRGLLLRIRGGAGRVQGATTVGGGSVEAGRAVGVAFVRHVAGRGRV